MKSYFRFTFLLILLAALAYLFYLNPFSKEFWSPHTMYERKLYFSEYSEAEIEEWKNAEIQAISDSLFVNLPSQIKLVGDAKDFTAWAYQMTLKEGQKLIIDFLDGAKSELFADVLFAEDKGNFRHIESVKENSTEIIILETGNYLLRLQSPINQSISSNISLNTQPAYDVFPVEGKGNKAIQSFWGAPRDGGRIKHEGIDIFAAKGTALLAVCDGEIDRVKESKLGGKVVWLYDAELDQSIYYAHLDEQLVYEGQYVKAGDKIGTMGNTGNARTTPPHLHFGIYLDKAIDPLYFVKKQTKSAKSPKYISAVGKRGMITSKPARMYFAPNPKNKARSVLVKGTIVNIIGAVGDFLHIKAADRRSYFVKKGDLKVE